MSAWLSAFLFTQAVEIPIYLRAQLAPRDGDQRADAQRAPPWPRALLVAFAASAITHPIVWFVIPRLIPGDYLTMVAIAEAFAVLVEALWLRAWGLERPLTWALFANAASLSVGLLSRRMFGWP